MVFAVFSFNVNAVVISITTDKAEYALNETVIATVSVSELLDGSSVRTLLSGFDVVVSAVNSSFVSNSVTFGSFISDPFDAFAAVAVTPVSASSVVVSEVASFLTDTNALQGNSGVTVFDLFTLQFTASTLGSDTLSLSAGLGGMLLDVFAAPVTPSAINNASFNVVSNATAVSAPSGLLVLLLSVLVLLRVRAK